MINQKTVKTKVFIIFILLGLALLYYAYKKETWVVITNFEECVNAWNPIMESYPRQCADEKWNTFVEEILSCANLKGDYMTLDEAKARAAESECWDSFRGNNMCNENTWTFWIDLDIEQEWCNPACVINLETKTAEINWRCTWLK